MTTKFDLVLLPLSVQGGTDQSVMPGLHVAVPPRRTARGRSSERLIIFLTLVGNAPLSTADTKKTVTHLEQVYYQTPGSSTAAMRSLAEGLNDYLLKRNQNGTNRGLHAAGLLTLVVVRSDRLYIAQSGLGHAYLMTSSGVQHFHRPDVEDRGLGIGRITHQKYFTGELVLGDKLLIAPNPSVAWTVPVLGEMYNLEMGELRGRLMPGTGDTLNAVLVLTESGKGSARILRPPLAQSSDDVSPADTTQPQPNSGSSVKNLSVHESSDILMEQPVSSYLDPPAAIMPATWVPWKLSVPVPITSEFPYPNSASIFTLSPTIERVSKFKLNPKFTCEPK